MRRIILVCLCLISLGLGYGKLPTGQERIIRFTVSGFTLSIPMYWTAQDNVAAQLPGIMRSGRSVQAFVNEAIKEQGRLAGLSFEAITAILDQLNVETNYVPLQCDIVKINPMPNDTLMAIDGMRESCYIRGTTVISLCRQATGQSCMFVNPFMHIIPVPPQHLTISGNLNISNVIMAGWSTQMWQSVLNRVLRSLQSGRLGSHFATAIVTIS